MENTPRWIENERIRKENLATRNKKLFLQLNTKVNDEIKDLLLSIENLIKDKKIKLTKIKNNDLIKIKNDNIINEYSDIHENDKYNLKKEYINTLEQIKKFIDKQETKTVNDKQETKTVKKRVKKVIKYDKDNIISLINIIDELLTNDKIKLTKLKTNLLSQIKLLNLDEIDNLELNKYYKKLLTIEKYINKKINNS